jgi:hypothetical protein
MGLYYRCRRCGKRKELRKGKRTGNNALKYKGLEGEVNASSVLKIVGSRTRPLCLPCLEELAAWLKDESLHLEA